MDGGVNGTRHCAGQEGPMALDQEFHQDMISGDTILKKQCSYNPTDFLHMVSDYDGPGYQAQEGGSAFTEHLAQKRHDHNFNF
jgi:hypothetical protein